MQLFAKFKKIMRRGLRATLNFQKIKVALNLLLAGGAFAKVQYFLWYKPTGEVMAVYYEVPINNASPFFLNDVGWHLVRIEKER